VRRLRTRQRATYAKQEDRRNQRSRSTAKRKPERQTELTQSALLSRFCPTAVSPNSPEAEQLAKNGDARRSEAALEELIGRGESPDRAVGLAEQR